MKEVTGTDVMRWIDRHDAKSKVSMRLKTYLAGVVVCAAFWGLTAYTVFAAGIDEVAIYMTDRGMCGLIVPQAWINEALIRASIERGITIEEAKWTAAAMSLAIDQAAKDLGRVREYCNARAVPMR